MAPTYIYVDVSQVYKLLLHMGKCLTPQKFDTLMRRTLNDVGRGSKTIIKSGIMAEYHASAGWVGKSIKGWKIEGGGSSILVRIPIISEKGGIGGHFSAGGGAYGWNPPSYNVTSLIVKDGTSVLPAQMSSYGGQPPFRNLGSGTYTRTYTLKSGQKIKKRVKKKQPNQDTMRKGTGSIVWTRAGKSRLPIMPVSGIAVPQMPLNRSRPIVEDRICSLAENRAIHHFSRIFG